MLELIAAEECRCVGNHRCLRCVALDALKEALDVLEGASPYSWSLNAPVATREHALAWHDRAQALVRNLRGNLR